jgi:hypothetical protein
MTAPRLRRTRSGFSLSPRTGGTLGRFADPRAGARPEGVAARRKKEKKTARGGEFPKTSPERLSQGSEALPLLPTRNPSSGVRENLSSWYRRRPKKLLEGTAGTKFFAVTVGQFCKAADLCRE